MSERSDLTVRLAELPTQRELRLGPAFVEGAIGTMPIRAALEHETGDPNIGAADATIELYLGTPGVFARGSMVGSLVVACSRCVEPVDIAVNDDISISFLPADQVPEEAEDEDEDDTVADIDLFPYEGEEIDLTDLFRERLIMAVPFAPLCSDECLGLCAVCGNNLNQSECGCDRKPMDPRLAPLRDLMLKE